MKHQLKRGVICIAIICGLHSCKKNEINLPLTLSPDDIALKEAKLQYDLAVKLGLPSTIEDIKLQPDWTTVSRHQIDKHNQNLYLTLGIDKTTKSNIQLVVRKKDGIINSYIVSAKPDLTKFNSETIDYNKLYGKMTFYDLSGKARKILLLEDGKPIKRKLSSTGRAVMSYAGGAVDQDDDGVLNWDDDCPDTPAGTMVDANGCPQTNDLPEVEISPDWTWPPLPPIELGGFPWPPMDPGEPGGPGPGGGTDDQTPSSTASYIVNEITDSCMNKAVGTALAANNSLVGIMADIIRNFDASKTIQVKIRSGQTQNGTPGEAGSTLSNGELVRVEITLQSSYFTGEDAASKESLIATLIHEVVHGYIRKIDPTIINGHHNVIAAKYIDPMAGYLQAYFGMSKVDAYALAWSGVADAKAFRDAALEDTFPLGPNGTLVTKSELISRGASYNGRQEYLEEGKKGQDICSSN